ncbi:ABC transporter permease [Thermospira aquatica]|uniref:Oligopeptide transport system permease protein OppC n=1 Tax=Thermospira aquatica TaxID=2828656 RepID=A0AAX3BA07_9SPIR|nr:ABC transporter permease [Thermospira aquatica]URA09083.1 ABC transporter permease [Thermospira aquatica]
MEKENRELHLEEVKGVSLWKDAWRRLVKNKMAVAGGIIVIFFVLVAIFAPVIAPYSYEEINFENPQINQPPSWEHLFGTDSLGRDLFSRIIYGSRVSISIGFVTGIVALLIGVTYGAIAGFVGGKLDEWMMRFADILYSLPYMFFVILLMVIFGRNFIMLFVGIASVSWMTIARITRGQIMSLKNNEFVEAAKSIGASRRRIIFRHLIPNALGPIIVYLTLTIPSIMLEEAFLSFLGLGVQAPMTSWGLLAAEGKGVITTCPWQIIFPGLALTLMLFSLNFLGEGLRDALDPSQKNKM